jgi:hypothetical protein
MNAAAYRRFRQASARFAQTEREERRIWSVSEYRSSTGNFFVNSKIRMAASNAIRYTSISSWLLIFIPALLPDNVHFHLLS